VLTDPSTTLKAVKLHEEVPGYVFCSPPPVCQHVRGDPYPHRERRRGVANQDGCRAETEFPLLSENVDYFIAAYGTSFCCQKHYYAKYYHPKKNCAEVRVPNKSGIQAGILLI
jgi:hypothetical protein